jgi:predicted deacylase
MILKGVISMNSFDLGDSHLECYELGASKAGPRLLVFGAIHGNETCGPEALNRLRRDFESGALELRSGSLRWVPICNPEAYRLNKRYIEENLNRVFTPVSSPTSYESRLAQSLCKAFQDVDYFLDLHSMQSLGDPFVFLNEPTQDSREFCEALKVSYVLEGWPEAYRSFPQFKSFCTQTFADQLKIPNALVECGQHGTSDSADVGYKSVLRALSFLGMIESSEILKSDSLSEVTQLKCITMKDIVFRENEGDRLSRDWKNFDPISQGDLLAIRASGEELRAPYNGFMILPSPDSTVGVEFYYLGS